MTSNVGSFSFTGISLTTLDVLSKTEIDELPFGVVGLSRGGTVDVYGATESKMAGLDRELIIGTHYFSMVAQCMNNYMVAQRLEDEAELDVVIDYVLTLRMRPTPVRLRLLKSATIERRYILIER